MPTTNRCHSISLDEARARAADHAFRHTDDGSRPGKVGLECELFPIIAGAGCVPNGRLRLEGGNGVIETLDALARLEPRLGQRRGGVTGPWSYPWADGGQITFEPGAQIEYSGAPTDSVAQALTDTRQVIETLGAAFALRQTVLASIGIDRWHEVEQVPQQLRAPRYLAQAAYYDRRGPWGRVMMRNTASQQLNLDLGPEGVWQERWLLANLLSPLMVATFACSPCDGWVATRTRAWQELDPTRSGFPDLLVNGPGNDPATEWAEAALAADLLLIRLADGSAVPGIPGLSFQRWISDGHAEHGWPTAEDLDYHLTTLFFEVRPRGFLELRAGEALPDSLRPAPVVLVTSLLYDDRARSEALALLDGQRPQLPELWQRAARFGIRDPELADLTQRTWEIALEGAARLPAAYHGAEALRATRDFLDQYPARGRMPADELRTLLTQGEGAALAWASATSQTRRTGPCAGRRRANPRLSV